MIVFRRLVVASKGDDAELHWNDLTNYLNHGYEIISGVHDGYVIHYILKADIQDPEVEHE